MKNRAKCKICGSTIESFHSSDYVECKCGEIAIDGGGALKCFVNTDWANFIRVDDEGNEVIPIIKDKQVLLPETPPSRPNRDELLQVLDDMIKSIENLPPRAMSEPITHYDFCSLLLLLSSILRAET